ncbi:hypothetical protein RJ640_003420 [Escallonia rubra]|uniref:BED-type domain-containing protein n=1 Tax=Escallonia rubra TaxID=112253 RepID=A0AA88RKG3_9ASTE|nr:hypothetical protein RJ640_003420 [Escallonia rubra]
MYRRGGYKINGFCDADYAGDKSTRRSTIGIVLISDREPSYGAVKDNQPCLCQPQKLNIEQQQWRHKKAHVSQKECNIFWGLKLRRGPHAPRNMTDNSSSIASATARSDDPAWAHGKVVAGKRNNTICIHCDKHLKGGGITRIKMHLAGVT